MRGARVWLRTRRLSSSAESCRISCITGSAHPPIARARLGLKSAGNERVSDYDIDDQVRMAF